MFFHLSIHLTIHPSIYQLIISNHSVTATIHFSINQSIHPSIPLFVRSFIHPSLSLLPIIRTSLYVYPARGKASRELLRLRRSDVCQINNYPSRQAHPTHSLPTIPLPAHTCRRPVPPNPLAALHTTASPHIYRPPGPPNPLAAHLVPFQPSQPTPAVPMKQTIASHPVTTRTLTHFPPGLPNSLAVILSLSTFPTTSRKA